MSCKVFPCECLDDDTPIDRCQCVGGDAPPFCSVFCRRCGVPLYFEDGEPMYGAPLYSVDYEPPVVTPVGNANDLLAQVCAGECDPE
jgi:hypothetical protein